MRILAIGDCNTGGISAARSENLPEELRQVLLAQGHQAELVNHGYAMTTTREGVVRAQEHHDPVDVLLINFGLVDSWWAVLPGWYIPYYPDTLRRKYARKFLKSLKKRLRSPFLRRYLPMGNTIPLSEYCDNYLKMIEAVRAHSPQANIVLWGLAPTRQSEEREVHIKTFDAAIKKMAEENNCIYIDTRDLFQPYTYEQVYRDHVHISTFGQQLLAAEIAQKIQASNS